MLRKAAQERGLTGPKGQRIEFINAGVAGYNSVQEYLYFASDLLRFKPDLVVAYDGWNDIFFPITKIHCERRITGRTMAASHRATRCWAQRISLQKTYDTFLHSPLSS
jgi:hypothetical protein